MGCEAGNRESPRGCASAPHPSPAGSTSTGLVCLRDQKRRWVMSRYTLTSLTYFCPCWVFVRLCRFSFYLWRVRATLVCCAQASHGSDFSCRGARALGPASFGNYSPWAQWLPFLGSREQAGQLWRTALRHVGSSQVRDGTCVSCIAGWTLYHWASGKAPETYIL